MATIVAASCSRADVSAAIDAAVNGDTVTIPPGECEWITTLSLSKAITLSGAGAGGFVGRSRSSVAIGTGDKTFTTQSGLAFVTGETITARFPDENGIHFMTGTVVSYSGTTLTLSVSTTGGSGTKAVWVFERPATTTITNSAVSASGVSMLQITESTAGNVRVKGIRFNTGTATLGGHISIEGIIGGRPVIISNNWFSQTGTLGTGVAQSVNRGVIHHNSFNGTLCSDAAFGCTPQINGALGMANESLLSSWNTVSSMGATDASGDRNIYYEDNYFLGFWQAMSGFDSAARVVFRNNILDQSALGSHGAETSPLGVRHWEVYSNTFYYDVLGAGCQVYNLNYVFYVRGGTGVIFNNAFDDINSPGCYGDKPEIVMTQQNLQRNTATNGCWGANNPGNQYPAPRQTGLGYVTGTGLDGLGNSTDSVTYVGDTEPIYIWNNGSAVVQVQDYGGVECINPDSAVDYIVLNRDYFLSAKPSYTPYMYPHPLTTEAVRPLKHVGASRRVVSPRH